MQLSKCTEVLQYNCHLCFGTIACLPKWSQISEVNQGMLHWIGIVVYIQLYTVLGLGAMISPFSLPCFHSNVVLRKIVWCSQWQFTWVHMEYVNKTKQPSVDTNQLYHTPPDSHNGIQHSIICTSLFTHNLYNQTIESPSLIYCHFKSCVLFSSLLQSPNK